MILQKLKTQNSKTTKVTKVANGCDCAQTNCANVFYVFNYIGNGWKTLVKPWGEGSELENRAQTTLTLGRLFHTTIFTTNEPFPSIITHLLHLFAKAQVMGFRSSRVISIFLTAHKTPKPTTPL
jgi:hypothetical protein